MCVVAFPFHDGPFESFDTLLISLRFENREKEQVLLNGIQPDASFLADLSSTYNELM